MAEKKGMGIKTSVKSGNFRPTKSGAGMTKKGVEAYRKANPGSKLQTAVTESKPSKGVRSVVVRTVLDQKGLEGGIVDE
jgi:hypothetical protein